MTNKDVRNREYLKAFISEFGSVANSEKWLDASRSTLTVISEHSNPVKVYYTDAQGKRILVGDLIIPAGSEEIPFMIPSDITSLIVEAAKGEYIAHVGSELNLDTAVPAGISRADETNDTPFFRPTPASRRIRFCPNDIMNVYWEKYPIRENQNSMESLNTGFGWGDYYFEQGNWMLYPVYARWDNNDESYANLGDGKKTTMVAPDGTMLEDDYFGATGAPMLSFYGWCPNCYVQDYYMDYATRYDPGDDDYPYPAIAFRNNVQSYGISIKPAATTTSWWYANVIFRDSNKEKLQRITSAPLGNMANWYTRFWNVSMEYPFKAYQHMVRYVATGKTVEIAVPQNDCEYIEGTDPTAYGSCPNPGGWVLRTIANPIFIGINRPPMEHKDPITGFYYGETDYYPDYNDIVFLLVPEEGDSKYNVYYGGGTISTSNNFLFAAEDLGGSYDWDFNDAVFSVQYVTKNVSSVMAEYYKTKIKYGQVGYLPLQYNNFDNNSSPYLFEVTVTPKAAGGTMPIYIAYHGKVLKAYDKYTDFLNNLSPTATYNDIVPEMATLNDISDDWEDGIHIIGEELHSWLGEADPSKVVNVTSAQADHTALYSVKFFVYDNPADYASMSVGEAGVGHLRRFSVIVEKDKTLNIPRPSEAESSKTVYDTGLTLFSPNGSTYEIGGVAQNKDDSAPQMICIGNVWPREEVNIKRAFNYGNEDTEKSLVEKWLEGGPSPWYSYDNDLVTK